MPEVELGERMQQEDFVEDRPGYQPGALPDLDVRDDALHDEFTATASAGPVGSDLGVVAAQCARGRDLIFRCLRAEVSPLLGLRAASPPACGWQAVRRKFLAR